MFIKILVAITYVSMVVVNFLANGLPINNRSTGAISDAYPNLFAPAGITFSIWGLIYLLLAGYVLYQFGIFNKNRSQESETLLKKVNIAFMVSSLANISWIFAWHYDFIWLSVIIMAVILGSLITIADTLRTREFTTKETLFILAPFSVYFGWITVATIANVTVLLVSIGWNGFGIAEYVWTSIMLLVGALIGIVRMRMDTNWIYGLVLIWAYLGILLKHLSPTEFGGTYPSIIGTVIVCLCLFVFFVSRILLKK